MTPIVILAGCRTPIGAFQGGLASVPAPRIGAVAIKAAVSRARLDPSAVTDVAFGTVLQAGLGQAPARQAAVFAGLLPSTRCVTVHKVCGSGMQAVMQGAHALMAGDAGVVVAGGMENMSAAPYLLPKARQGYRLGHMQAIDSVIHDGLWDPYADLHMGSCAEQCAAKHGITRQAQDAYAAESFRRAHAAQHSGAFADEIVPVEVSDTVRVERDEGPTRVNFERMPSLRPAFDPAGTITVGNASSINDGAAALVLTTQERAHELGAAPVARIVAFGVHAHEPTWFTTAPPHAAKLALKRAGWSVDEVDLWEVNEAFAMVPLVFMRELAVDHAKVNVRGGAISLGHPIGASGARVLVTLLSALRERGGRRGVAAICLGGGEAMAVCVERL